MLSFLEFVDVLNWNRVRLSDVQVAKEYEAYRMADWLITCRELKIVD